MRFALFYEIPVPRPWGPDSEYGAYRNTLEQAIAGERCGWDAFWTVEHHFLEEYSHCSNPEVLYGAIAARTEHIRLGYGVRLMPQPYNHPVRSAESIAVLDLISDGRVEVGTGRSSTRAELEGFGIDPADTRAMWQEAIEHMVGCWTDDEHAFDGRYWQMPPRRVLPKPLQAAAPAALGRDVQRGRPPPGGQRSGSGCARSRSACRPRRSRRRSTSTARRIAGCTEPIGAFVNSDAATFTMTLCAPDRDEALSTPPASRSSGTPRPAPG